MQQIKVRMYPALSEIGNERGGINAVIQSLYRVAAGAGIVFVENDDEADVIASHAGVKINVRGKPVVAMIHGVYFSELDPFTEEWQMHINARVIESVREAMEVTVPSRWVANVFERDMHFSPNVIGHGVFHEDAVVGSNNPKVAIWNKNRISDACDPERIAPLLDAFPKMKFVSTFHPQSRGISPTQLYTNLRVTGVIPSESMLQEVGQAGIYLSTTKETFGIGILEALASGLPVLCYNEGAAPDLIQHKVNGYIAQDEKDLIAGFAWLVEHQESMREDCMKSARAYDWKNIALEYRTVFERAIEKYRWLQGGECSVVIPCYNRADTLPRAIESVLAQTRPARRIIVVDNNSTDHTKHVAGSYADRGVLYVNESRQGVAHARNAGIAMLDEPFVLCLDADDEIAPDMLAATVPALVSNPTLGVAYTGILAVTEDGTRSVSEWPLPYNFDSFMNVQNQVPTCCVFRTDMWKRLGGFRQRYAPQGAGSEDAEFFFRSGAMGWRAERVTSDPLFIYHYGAGITSASGYKEMDWRYWHPWVQDGRHPIGSLARPSMHSHLARFYDKPSAAVIIPCGEKHLRYLWDAIDSVEGQTARLWELVVVLDFDATGNEDVERLKNAYPFATWVQGEGRGAGAARNLGVRHSKAPNLLFLDADDFLRPDALYRMLVTLEDTDSVAYSDYVGHAFIEKEYARQMDKSGRLIAYDESDGYAHMAYQGFEYDCEKALRQPQTNEEPYLWCLVSSLTKREWHDAIGGFDESMESWEDWDYWLRVAWLGVCFERIKERLVEYRFYSGERREHGRQLARDLIHYMQDKKKGATLMPCGSCGKRRNVTPVAQPAPFVMKSFMEGTMTIPTGTVVVKLNDGNTGLHRFVGPQTKTDYGYRAHGDEFIVATADYEARKDVLLVLDEEASAPKKEPAKQTDDGSVKGTPIESLEGISPAAVKSLADAGIATVEDAVYAGEDTVAGLDRVGDKTVDLIFASKKKK